MEIWTSPSTQLGMRSFIASASLGASENVNLISPSRGYSVVCTSFKPLSLHVSVEPAYMLTKSSSPSALRAYAVSRYFMGLSRPVPPQQVPILPSPYSLRAPRSAEHTSELQSRGHLVRRL